MTPSRLARGSAHAAIRAYQLSLSGLAGRQCRFLPSCSDYADDAIRRHGLWPGVWMGAGRLCRCHPWGGAGFDPVPLQLPSRAAWYRPWSYARRDVADQDRASSVAERA